jgi:adenosylcobinamide-GDP ribazoletransferase
VTRTRRAELASAFLLLTRLPVGWLTGGGAPADLVDSVWAFPIVGVAVGGIGGVAYWVCARLGLPPAVAAVWTLAALLLATGALHEDGLADTADGFGGGRTPARKLEIMRDSRIGSFGALALALSLAARGTSIAAIALPGHVTAALVASGALGRGAILIVLLALPPARADGLGAGLKDSGSLAAAVGLALASVVALACGAGWAVPAALVAALAVAWLARRQIGGYTGDVLGAASVVAECAALALLSAR